MEFRDCSTVAKKLKIDHESDSHLSAEGRSRGRPDETELLDRPIEVEAPEQSAPDHPLPFVSLVAKPVPNGVQLYSNK
eukprot:g20700.t1